MWFFTEIIYGSMSFTAVRLVCSLRYSFPIWGCLTADSSGGQDSPDQNAINSKWWDVEKMLESV